MKRAAIIAHRGVFSPRFENTVVGIEVAVAQAVDFVEIDLRMSKDGSVIALHDRTVDRTTSGTGRAAKMTLEELKALTVCKIPGQGRVTIPTVEECVRAAAGRVGVIFEVKGRMTSAALARLGNLCRDNFSPDRLLVASRSTRTLAHLRQGDPTLPTGSNSLIESLLVRFCRKKPRHYDVLIVNEFLVSQNLVKRVNGLGLRIFVSAPKPKRNPNSVLSLGVDGLYVNLKPAFEPVGTQ